MKEYQKKLSNKSPNIYSYSPKYESISRKIRNVFFSKITENTKNNEENIMKINGAKFNSGLLPRRKKDGFTVVRDIKQNKVSKTMINSRGSCEIFGEKVYEEKNEEKNEGKKREKNNKILITSLIEGESYLDKSKIKAPEFNKYSSRNNLFGIYNESRKDIGNLSLIHKNKSFRNERKTKLNLKSLKRSGSFIDFNKMQGREKKFNVFKCCLIENKHTKKIMKIKV